jgi:cation transporter-like permease
MFVCIRILPIFFSVKLNHQRKKFATTFAVTMAAVKVKLTTGTLTLQEHKAKFARKGEVSFLCPMCKQETENTAHSLDKVSK